MISTLLSNLKDSQSLEIHRQIERLAGLDTPFLVCGETGSGKDFWVQVLAEMCPGRTLLNLHCADVPETLLESEWFGYRRGAFTGAERDYAGKWLSAAGGIIFLNQIDLLPLGLQAKLLRIIERRRFYALGAAEETPIDARFVFSADAAIEERVRSGAFRSDLYYRIATFKIDLPPLRERRPDLESLLAYFAGREGVRLELTAAGRRRLLAYPWPGNIRELENFVVQAGIGGKRIGDAEVEALATRGGRLLERFKADEPTLDDLSMAYIRHLLKKYRNKSRVAEILGITRKSLYNKLKSHDRH